MITLPAGLQHSLRALGHPLSLASVALLLVNDHVLKRAYPSELTGKLSDFAGLFFFPYLLIALANLARWALGRHRADRAGRPPEGTRGAAWPAYLLSTCLFAAAKLDPALNAGINRLLQYLLGLPVQVARDPSDLVALLALAPSWRLWETVRSNQARTPMRRSLIALGLASLAAVATAPCPPEQPITHLVPHEGRLYALATAWEPVSSAFIDTNAGRFWDNLDPAALPEAVLAAAAVPVKLPKVVCVPGQEQTCYRAAGREQLEASADGGQSWQVVWSPSQARRPYMDRVATGYGTILACGESVDLRANDLAVIGQGQDHTVIAALGNQGVLVGRYGRPDWERFGVGSAIPTPERGGLQDLLPPVIILGETVLALVGGSAVFIYLSAVAWPRLESGAAVAEPGGGRSPWITVGIIDFVLLVLLVLLNLEELLTTVLLPLLGLSALIAGMVVRWTKAFRRTPRPSDARRALGLSAGGGLLAAFGFWLPFALWVLGLIPGYGAALVLALAASIAVTVWNQRRLPPGSRPTPSSDQPLS